MLKTHLKTHKKYSCADCGYSSTEALQAHMNGENHKGAPTLNAMRVRNRVDGLANRLKNPNSRCPGGLKARKRLALNGSQTDSVAAASMESSDPFAIPLNAFHLNESFGPSQAKNQPKTYKCHHCDRANLNSTTNCNEQPCLCRLVWVWNRKAIKEKTAELSLQIEWPHLTKCHRRKPTNGTTVASFS